MAQRKRLRALAGRRARRASGDLPGGVYQVQRNSASASYVEVPLAEPDSFRACDLYK
jgi:hypothetical protein